MQQPESCWVVTTRLFDVLDFATPDLRLTRPLFVVIELAAEIEVVAVRVFKHAIIFSANDLYDLASFECASRVCLCAKCL
jgi:hypothetical protein